MSKFTDPLPTVMVLAAFMVVAWSIDKRLEIINCNLQVQTARIDLLNGLEITRPECLDKILKKPTKPALHGP